MSYKWKNTNSKLTKYGGLLIGSYLICVAVKYYPAVVLGIMIGMLSEAYETGLWPGLLTFVAIALTIQLLMGGCRNGNQICAWILIAVYLLTIVPFFQYVYHIYHPEYIGHDIDGKSITAPFDGFDWSWIIDFPLGMIKNSPITMLVVLPIILVMTIYQYFKDRQ